MKTKVTLKGGFHHRDEIKIYVDFPFSALCDYHDGKIKARDLINDYISEHQDTRLEKHFCGVRGCHCGAWYRATIYTDDIDHNANLAKLANR